VLKKTITYEDFNGHTATEDFYFHLSKGELAEMEISHHGDGGLGDYVQRIVDSKDGAAIVAEFKKIILMSIGKKSDDGRRFIKNDQLREEFQSSEAFSVLFIELVTDVDAAAKFINGIVPTSLEQDVDKILKSMHGQGTLDVPDEKSAIIDEREAVVGPRKLTPLEIGEMDADELKSGLATGKYSF
jgi:hypothetical protein